MATNPGLFTEWPWKRLGSFKVCTCRTISIAVL
jgi:hypothetical protein